MSQRSALDRLFDDRPRWQKAVIFVGLVWLMISTVGVLRSLGF